MHTHSTVSDGSLTPSALARVAAEAGVTALSLTDHDSTEGLEEAETAAGRLGLEFIRGCEVSASGSVDVLGYYLPRHSPPLEEALDRLRDTRNARNAAVLERLSALGMPLSEEEVRAQGVNVFGRPHIAAAMLHRGYVRRLGEAFALYLGNRGSAYVPKDVFSAEEAVSLLTGIGASSFIAHPLLLRLAESDLEKLVRRLIPLGLTGIEVYHSEHDRRGERLLLGMAERYRLLSCGGSDFHGRAKPGVELGRGRGGLRVPALVLDKLKEHRLERGLPV